MKRPKSHSHLAACLACAAAFPAALIAQATDATWSGAIDQDWNDNGNWTYNAGPNVFPNAIDTIARFQGAATGMVSLNQDITIGHLSFTSGSYTITGGAGIDLIFSVSSGNATISSSSSSEQILQPNALSFASPLVVTNTGSGVLALNNLSGTADLTIGQGTVQFGSSVFSSTTTGTLTIESGATLQGGNNTQLSVGGLSGSGTLELWSAGDFGFSPFTVNSSDTTTFSGTITVVQTGFEFGEFLKTGSGTLILTGTNNLSAPANQGFLQISAGILSVSSLSNLGNPDTLAMGGGALQITGSSPFTYANPVTLLVGTTSTFDIGSSTALTLSNVIANSGGAGSLTKAGGGTLTLSNANTYTGTTTVNAGQLNVTGSITSNATVNGGFLNVTGTTTGTVTVNSGGTLKGTGTVQNVTAASGGTVAPGTSIGTLTIDGDLSMTDSILSIEISPSAASKVEITGQALLTGPTVQVVANPGSYGNSGQYEILTVAGGVTGVFLSATGNLSGYTFSLTHDANSVFLNYLLTGFIIPTAGITGNAGSWERYLERNVPLSQATELLSALSGQTLQEALESSSPQRNALAPFAAQNTLFALGEVLNGHLSNHRFFRMRKSEWWQPPQSSVAGLFMEESDTRLLADNSELVAARATNQHCMKEAPSCKNRSDRYTFWIGGFGQYAHQDAQEQNPAFNFMSGGGLLAFDFYGAPHNLFGSA